MRALKYWKTPHEKAPQNAAGWSQLTVDNCPKGTNIKMYFAENLCGYGTTRWSPRCAAGQLPGEGVTGTVELDAAGDRSSGYDILILFSEADGGAWEAAGLWTASTDSVTGQLLGRPPCRPLRPTRLPACIDATSLAKRCT